MNRVVEEFKDGLRGTWIHHAVWAYRNPPPKLQRVGDEKKVAPADRNAAYDRQTVELMFRVLHKNSNCIDVGAHSGDILRHMVDIAPRGSHYAFEPLPYFSQIVRERFPRVIVHEAAIADISGDSEFQFVENDPAYSCLQSRIYYRPDPKITTIRVRVVALDEVIPANEKIAFIKIDIEGGEFHAIKGGIDTIRRGKSVIVFEGGSHSMGQYGVKPDDVYFLVTQTLGYELSTIERWLGRKSPYAREEFARNWDYGPEYFFIAAPKYELRWRVA